ncbi:MAG TPA: cyclic nucleotide-binding domain-containing protein [Candidatus Limnocylindrales bacterium]|jgi:signal transduction histidine kinase|nr:cyclic nucleotide-binding domain-containing protein [Candidatus Limnocylindrales bacterium]
MVLLEASRFFCQFSKEEMATLRTAARELTFRAGEEIFKEGDEGDGVYVVKDGLVEISARMGQNVRQVLTQVLPGELFGEMAVIEDKPRSATASVKEDTVVYFIPRKEMLALIEHSPKLSLGLLREISHRLREFDRQYLREVLQAERLSVIGRFARSIVHDLKNPLNIIGLTAEIAGMSQSTPETRRQAVANIRQQVDRISDMIGEILDFTQGVSPNLVLPPMDYSTFVQEVVAELQTEASLRSVMVEFQNPPPAQQVVINPKRLRRVFHNIVHNATEAMAGGGKIMLRFQSSPKEVVTEIEDTGPGIAPEMNGQLFEAFATFGKVHGTGLGLSICKRIIEDHHGWITGRSEPGRGAIFAFGLPVS